MRRSESEYEQHGLVTLILKLRNHRVLAQRDPAQARQDGNVLLAVHLERHRRRVEADPDIDPPQRLERRVVIGDERAVGELGYGTCTLPLISPVSGSTAE